MATALPIKNFNNSASSRYSSYDSTASFSSQFSDPSSSSELNNSSSSARRAIVKSKPLDLSQNITKNTKTSANHNLTSMMQKLMSKKSSASSKAASNVRLVIPDDLIAQDLKKTARKNTAASNLASGIHRKLFGREKEKKKQVKALSDVKENTNTRTLAMVLRSERELLAANKDQEAQIAELNALLEHKNSEVEKLKDLCLKQREEIKGLKNAVLFPDETNSHLNDLLERQGSELKQTKQLIPTLQKQVTSLTGQLQCLAVDLAEVKAEKHASKGYLGEFGNSPRTPMYDHEGINSLEFSSGDPTTPDSPDDLYLEDLNPCLTPYAKTKSKEFEEMGFDSPYKGSFDVRESRSHVRSLSKSSDGCQSFSRISTAASSSRRSDETKGRYGKGQRRFH